MRNRHPASSKTKDRSYCIIQQAVFAVVVSLIIKEAHAADYYWDTNGSTTGLGSATTPANWSGSFWNTDSTGGNGGTVSTWTNVTSNNAILAGTAGTLTIDGGESTGVIVGTLTVNTDGYKITSTSNSRPLAATSLVLANNVGITLDLNSSNGDWTLSGATLGTSSTLNITGTATSGNANRIDLKGPVSGGSIVLNASGAGIAGFVATATGVSISTSISNSSTSTTMIGATSGNDLTLTSTAIISGSAGVQFSAGGSSGAGLVIVNSANTYAGATTLNNSTTGVIRLGVDNALPTSTALQFGVGGNKTGTLDLNGHSQTVGSLAVTGTDTVNGIANTSVTSATLIISGSAITTYSSIIGTPVNVTNIAGANNGIALTLAAANTGSLTLTGANTYTGATTVSGGTLKLSGSGSSTTLGSTSTVTVNTGGTLMLGASNQINDTATMKLAGGTFSTGGFSESVGTLTLSNNSIFDLGIGGASVLKFAASNAISWSGTLKIYNYTGTSTPSDTDELFVGTNSSGLTSSQLNSISFYSDAGTTLLGTGSYIGSVGQVGFVAVPEPSTWLGGSLIFGLAGFSQRKRLALALNAA